MKRGCLLLLALLGLACGAGRAEPALTPAIRRLPTATLSLPPTDPTIETYALPTPEATPEPVIILPTETATPLPTETFTLEPTVVPPTETPVPPTDTPIPPTVTPVLPTDTPLPPPPVPTLPPNCECSFDAYNCKDTQAVQCFRYCQSIGAGDIHRLDGDNDGVACE